MSRSYSNALEPAPADDLVYGNEQPTKRLPMLTPFDLAQEARRLDEEARKRDEAAREREEAGRAAHGALDDERTVTIGADENKRLLASVLAHGDHAGARPEDHRPLVRDDRYDTDDEPTLDAPSPVTSLHVQGEREREPTPVPVPVRITARPPALRAIVFTRPAPAPAPKSTPRAEVSPIAVISPCAVPPMEAPSSTPAVNALRALAAVPAIAATPAAPAVFVTAPASGFRARITPELAKAARELHAAEDARLRGEATFTIRLPKRSEETYLVAGIWAMALSLIAVLMFMASSA
jgi:hypothetical protein